MNFRTLVLVSFTFFAYFHARANPESVPGEFVVKLRPQLKLFTAQSLQDTLSSNIKSTIPNQNLVVIQRPKKY
jgi:hypothetical protein